MGYSKGDLTLEETPTKKRIRGRASKKASTSFVYGQVNNNKTKGKYMSRKQRRANNQKNEYQNHAEKNHFELRHIQPLTVNQERVFDAYYAGQNLMLHG